MTANGVPLSPIPIWERRNWNRSRFPPVRVTETRKTVKITEPELGRFVFDLGQNMVGWPLLNIPVEKDQTITIRFAEMLKQDGTMYTENYRTAKSIDFYTAAENWNNVLAPTVYISWLSVC